MQKKTKTDASRARRRAPRRWEPTEGLTQSLLDWLASGKTLRAWSRRPSHPTFHTVYQWLKTDAALRARVEEARQVGAEQILEEMLAIADTPEVGEVVTEESVQVEVAGGAAPAVKRTVRREDMLGHRKLQLWAREKLLRVWFPERFSDKARIQHSGKVTLEDLVAGSHEEQPD